ncbi:putative anion transporter 6, chloroplastic [Drosera capensis]
MFGLNFFLTLENRRVAGGVVSKSYTEVGPNPILGIKKIFIGGKLHSVKAPTVSLFPNPHTSSLLSSTLISMANLTCRVQNPPCSTPQTPKPNPHIPYPCSYVTLTKTQLNFRSFKGLNCRGKRWVVAELRVDEIEQRPGSPEDDGSGEVEEGFDLEWPPWRNLPKRYKLIGITSLAFVICNMDKVNLSIAIIPMSHQFGWNSSVAGLVQSSFFWGYALSQLPGGWLAKIFGGRQVLAIGVLIWSFATALIPLVAGNMSGLVFSRILDDTSRRAVTCCFICLWRIKCGKCYWAHFGSTHHPKFRLGIGGQATLAPISRSISLDLEPRNDSWSSSLDELRGSLQVSVLPPLASIFVTNIAAQLADNLISRGVDTTTVRKLCQTIAFVAPALCMTLSSVDLGLPHWEIVGILTTGLALSSFALSGLYCTHQDISPEYASILLGITNTVGAVPGIVGVALTGYLLDSTHSWSLSLFAPSIFFYLTGTAVWLTYASSKPQSFAKMD